MIRSWTKWRNSFFWSDSEEHAADPSTRALSLVDEVELADELVHCVARLRDGTEIRDQVHVVTLLPTHNIFQLTSQATP